MSKAAVFLLTIACTNPAPLPPSIDPSGGPVPPGKSSSPDASANDAASSAIVAMADYPRGLALVGPDLYYTELTRVARVSIFGGPATEIAKVALPEGIAATIGTVCWTSGGKPAPIQCFDLSGQITTTLAADQPTGPFIAIDGDAVYWGSGSASATILRGKTNASGFLTVGSVLDVSSTGIAVAGSNVIFATSGFAGGVFRVPASGGVPSALDESFSKSYVDLVVDGDFAYALAATQIVRYPLAGGLGKPIATVLGTRIATDGTTLYVSNTIDGTVSSVPIEGGAVATVASGLDIPSALVVGTTYVYVATRDAIVRLQK